MSVILELNKRKVKSHYGTSFSLESLAWSSASFKKAFRGLSDQTASLINTEEFGRFLKQCIRIDLLPTREQLYGGTNLSQKKTSFVELFLEEKENDKKLEEGKLIYRQYLFFALDSIESSFHDILLNEIIKNALLLQKQVECNYISRVERLKKNSLSKCYRDAVSTKSPSESTSSGSYSPRNVSTKYFSSKRTLSQPEAKSRQLSMRKYDQGKKFKYHMNIEKSKMETNPSAFCSFERRSTQDRKEVEANAVDQMSVMLNATSITGK